MLQLIHVIVYGHLRLLQFEAISDKIQHEQSCTYLFAVPIHIFLHLFLQEGSRLVKAAIK